MQRNITIAYALLAMLHALILEFVQGEDNILLIGTFMRIGKQSPRYGRDAMSAALDTRKGFLER